MNLARRLGRFGARHPGWLIALLLVLAVIGPVLMERQFALSGIYARNLTCPDQLSAECLAEIGAAQLLRSGSDSGMVRTEIVRLAAIGLYDEAREIFVRDALRNPRLSREEAILEANRMIERVSSHQPTRISHSLPLFGSPRVPSHYTQMSEEDLRQEFQRLASERHTPLRSDANDVIRAANEKGFGDLALEVARYMAERTFLERREEIRDREISVLGMLISANAPREEIDAAIDYSMDRLPALNARDNVYWEYFPSRRRAQFAFQLARLGEFELAADIVQGVGGPLVSWKILISPHFGFETMLNLLDRADRDLNRHEMAALQAYLAHHVSTHTDNSPEIAEWAHETVWRITQNNRYRTDLEIQIRKSVLEYAIATGDADLERATLERLAIAALRDLRPETLIDAAFELHVSPNAPF